MSDHTSRLPFTQVVNVRTLPRKGRRAEREPDEAERAAIAAHVDVLRFERLRLEAEILPWKRDGIRIEGRIEAALEQACVVTLEPVDTILDERFETLLVPEGSKLASPRLQIVDSELVLDAEGDDPPETFAGDTIDLADVWLEFLALAIDPFPRAPGAVLESDEIDERPSPFAALAALKPANDG